MRFKIAGLAFGALLSVCVSAHAVTVDVVYTGTVSSGFDFSGLFGAPTNLAGKAFTAEYVFDTSLGDITRNATTAQNNGGTGFPGTTSPNLSAALTISGHTLNVSGSFLSLISAFQFGSQVEFISQVQPDGTHFLYNYLLAASIPISVDSNFSHTFAAGDQSGGRLFFANDDIQFTTSTLTVTGGPTPIPAALPLFATGLGVVGLLARRRKRKSGVAG